MGLGMIGKIGAATERPFMQTTNECGALFDVERENDSITVTSPCRGNPTLYEEGEMFRRAKEVISVDEFQKLGRNVDVTFDIEIMLDEDSYISSATIRATPEAMSEYAGVFETIAKRICSELRTERHSHQSTRRRFPDLHLTITGRR